MNHEEKVTILLDSIKQRAVLGREQGAAVENSISDGLKRIDLIEREEKNIDAPEFPVQHVKEGFALWTYGGYDNKSRKGSAIMAVGMDGKALSRIRTSYNEFGFRVQFVVYPGCYIAEARAAAGFVVSLSVYRILRFRRDQQDFYAVCERVYRDRPYYCTMDNLGDIYDLLQDTGNLALNVNTRMVRW